MCGTVDYAFVGVDGWDREGLWLLPCPALHIEYMQLIGTLSGIHLPPEHQQLLPHGPERMTPPISGPILQRRPHRQPPVYTIVELQLVKVAQNAQLHVVAAVDK